MDLTIGGHSGTWVHRKVGYHLAQWISPEFAVRVSNILDELFIMGSVTLGKEKSFEEIESVYQKKVASMQQQLDEQATKLDEQAKSYQSLLVKHNSSLKNHRYPKFKEKGPCFYIVEQGTPCECKHNIDRKKFGIAGLYKDNEEPDTIDNRLKSHRTIWPQLKVEFIVFTKDVDVLEKRIKRIYRKEINPNGHEIIEGVSTERLVETVMRVLEATGIDEYTIASNESIAEYNDFVVTTVKSQE